MDGGNQEGYGVRNFANGRDESNATALQNMNHSQPLHGSSFSPGQDRAPATN